MLSEVMLISTLSVTEVAVVIGEIIDVGLEIDDVIMGAEVACPVVLRLVLMVPVVSGTSVLSGGKICTVPELVDVVITETLAVTVEVVSDAKSEGMTAKLDGTPDVIAGDGSIHEILVDDPALD
jgi:hypothetical protein